MNLIFTNKTININNNYDCIFLKNLEDTSDNKNITIDKDCGIFEKYIINKEKIDFISVEYIENLFLEFGYYGYTEGINKLRELTKDKIKKEYVNSKSIEDFFEKHKYCLNWTAVVLNPNISEKFLEDNIEFVDCNNTIICQYKCFSESFLEKYFNIFNLKILLLNENISELFFEKHIDRIKKITNDISNIYCNKNCSEGFFKKIIENHDVNWYNLSSNPNISETFLEDNIDKINWKSIQKNPNVAESFFRKYFNKFIEKYDLIENPNISERFLEDYIVEFSKDDLYSNPNISECFIKKYLLKDPYINYNLLIIELLKNKIVSNQFIFDLIKNNKHLLTMITIILISSSKRFSMEEILKNQEYIQYNNKAAFIRGISLNENFNEEYFYNNEYNIYYICQNSSLSQSFFEHIYENKKYPASIFENTNLNEKFFEKYLNDNIRKKIYKKICLSLSSNTFRYYHKIDYTTHYLSKYL